MECEFPGLSRKTLSDWCRLSVGQKSALLIYTDLSMKYNGRCLTQEVYRQMVAGNLFYLELMRSLSRNHDAATFLKRITRAWGKVWRIEALIEKAPQQFARPAFEEMYASAHERRLIEEPIGGSIAAFRFFSGSTATV